MERNPSSGLPATFSRKGRRGSPAFSARVGSSSGSAHPATPVTLGFGSNLGDKVAAVRDAVDRIFRAGLVHDVTMSSLYRTAPWGDEDQDWFVNACLAGKTDLAPIDLLGRLKAIEAEMGRATTRRWGPRIIDLDILTYGTLELESPDLTLPHRELLNRAFVLVPLAEIRPALVVRGVAVGEAAARLGPCDVTKLDPGHILDGLGATSHL